MLLDKVKIFITKIEYIPIIILRKTKISVIDKYKKRLSLLKFVYLNIQMSLKFQLFCPSVKQNLQLALLIQFLQYQEGYYKNKKIYK